MSYYPVSSQKVDVPDNILAASELLWTKTHAMTLLFSSAK